jgi:hypothetical protein
MVKIRAKVLVKSAKSGKTPSSPTPKRKGAKPSRQKPDHGRTPYQPKFSGPKPDSFFPKSWTSWADEAIPSWVKKTYSPKESWKNKPFSEQDAHFFFKGIEELSELFTEDRPQKLPQYFRHPKFRSSYLLYFLPLQASKFITAFQLHPDAIQAALEHGEKQGHLSVIDLGAGPGTASFALIMHLLEMSRKSKREFPRIEFHWVDTQTGMMKEGEGLLQSWVALFPELHQRISVKTHTSNWWEASKNLPKETSLIFMGHVLNESAGPALPTRSTDDEESIEAEVKPNEAWLKTWHNLVGERAQGGGLLCIEPAAKQPSQLLSALRDHFFASGLVEKSVQSLWGPCMHAGRCPLSQGRDWCHFSIPTHIPGKWFTEFSKGLGSERLWVKFSYLWVASQGFKAPTSDKNSRRVISDPIFEEATHQGPRFVLLCEPERPGKLRLRPGQNLWRGEVVKV